MLGVQLQTTVKNLRQLSACDVVQIPSQTEHKTKDSSDIWPVTL